MSSEKFTGSSVLADHSPSTDSEVVSDADVGYLANVLPFIAIGLLVLIPVTWPFLIIYWCRTRPQHQNYHDVENPPIGSAPEPIGYVESDVSESNSVIIKLRPPNIDGVRYKLDSDTSFKSCFNGYKIDGLPVGQHEIIFQFTPTGSSEPVCEPPQKFIVWPTITTDKDTATLGLDTDSEVIGTFRYKLDDSEQSQPCSLGNDLMLPKLSAGVHCIVLKFTPTDLSEVFSTSTKFHFEIEPTAYNSVSANGEAELNCNTPGKFAISLDGGVLKQCSDDNKFDLASFEHHTINIQFTSTGSSQALRISPLEFIRCPEIIHSVTAEKDTATLHLSTKPEVKGTFQYKLDDNEQFQQCSSRFTLPNLSTGVHHIVFHFIPNDLPEAHSTTQECQFEIEPTAHSDISVNEDTVTANLYANTKGIFTYSLDGTTFQKYIDDEIFKKLPVGRHTITFQFTPTGSSQPLPLTPQEFIIRPTIIPSLTTDKDKASVTMDLETKPKVQGTFEYKLDDSKQWQKCLSGKILPKLSAGTHHIVYTFTPTHSPEAAVTSPEHQFDVEITAHGSVSFGQDTATIELYSNTEGTFEFSLDDAAFLQCDHGYPLNNLTVGHHIINFVFTPTGSSEALCPQPHKFIMHPTISSSVTTDKDTAILHLDTKPKVDGTFWYKLNNNRSFQQCPSDNTLQKLSAGTYRITFKSIPTNSPEAFSISEELHFKIEPIATCNRSAIIVEEDTATIGELYSNTKGTFEYSLDESTFQKCVEGEKLTRLTAGTHAIIVRFTTAKSHKKIHCLSHSFEVKQIAKVSITLKEDVVIMEASHNFPTKLQYSLDEADLQSCSSKKEFSKLLAGCHCVKVKFIPNLPSLQTVEKSKNFTIPLKANGSVTISKDKAVMDLVANSDGRFQYSLDGQTFEKFESEAVPYNNCLQEIAMLTAARHCLKIQLVRGSSETLAFQPLTFTMLSKDWYTSHCRPVGLQNLGNTCFFNSALQSTLKTDVFHEFPLKWEYEQKFTVSTNVSKSNDWQKTATKPYTKSYEVPSKTSDTPLKITVPLKLGPLTEALINLLTDTNTNTVTGFSFRPRDLLGQLGKRNPRFVQKTQEDSHEALRCMLDAIKNEEIDQVKKAIKEHFGAIDSRTEASLDGETKLKMKGYVRMASKVPTIIGEVVEGKIISVTICHECLDVSENLESFFDISLPMPEENWYGKNPYDKSNMDASSSSGSSNYYSDDDGSNVTTQPTDSQSDVSDTKSNVNVADQQHTMSTDVPANQQHNPTGDHNASLTTGADQQSGTPNNDTTEDVHTTESEGTGTGIPVVAMSVMTGTSDTEIKLESHVVSAEGASVDSSNKETVSSPQNPSVSQEVKQEDERAKFRDARKEKREKKLITHKKNKFQEYLIKKGLNYQSKGKQEEGTDLQTCLSAYTDLDVLDEDNKFICQACTRRNQAADMDDEPVLCRVSKQLMIHQLPPILILHMKRFEIGWDKVTKDDRHITFSKLLDIAPYCTAQCVKESGDSSGKILYGLYAVVVHQGAGLDSGHYIACVKTRPTEEKNKLDKDEYKDGWHYDEGYCDKGQWYHTSDSYVRECSFEEVKGNKAYMLFYERLPIAPASLI